MRLQKSHPVAMRTFRPARLAAALVFLILLAAQACASENAAGNLPGASPAPTLVPPPPQPQTSSAPPGQSIRFETISVEEGLSQSTVSCMLQDREGFLWFGTEDGLDKYDGYTFMVYRHDPENPASLSDNTVQALYEDAEGNLWIGTNGGGLDRFERARGEFVHYRAAAGDPRSLSSNVVNSIYQDREGVLWVGTNNGLNRLDAQTGEFARYQNNALDEHSLGSNAVLSIYQDRAGALWIGTAYGLDRFERGAGQFSHYRHDPGDSESLSNVVTAIEEDGAGGLWLGTSGGLDRFDPATGEFTHYRHMQGDPYGLSDNEIRAVHQDQQGLLWIGTYGGGLNRFDPQTGQFVHYQNNPYNPHSLSNDFVLSVYEDRAGMLWIGTFGGGVNKCNRGVERFAHYYADPNDPYSLSNNVVFSLYEDHAGALWVATYGGGLNRLDRETGRFTRYRHDPDNPYSLSDDEAWIVYEDREGTLWVGTNSGLDRLDRRTGQFAHYQYDPGAPDSLSGYAVSSIYQDRAGVLWVGTHRGLNRLDREAGRFTRYQYDPLDPRSLGSNDVWVIYEDREGVLWIGTNGGGLNRLDRETELTPRRSPYYRFTRYQSDPNNPRSLSHNTVLCIYQDRAGRLWIGTWGGGLNLMDRATGTFTHYTARDGLPNDVVYGILEDAQGFLWLSTNKGLSRFDPQTETFRNYTAADGLQGDEFNIGAYHQGASGEMFFGGSNGFTAFYPEQITDNPFIPPIVVTAFSKFNQVARTDVPAGEHIRLSYRENFVSFDFAALDYTAPEKNQYAYMMEGLDREWVYAGTRRHADYPSLRPGDYVFRVKGSNGDGVWNEEGAAITITITPPFWATWWFRGLIALALVGAVVAGYRLRVRSVEARSRALETQVANRTKELAALNAVAAVVSRSLNLREILADALDKALQVMEIEAGGIYLLDEAAGVLTVAAQSGLSPRLVAEIDNLKVGEGFSGRVVQVGQPLVEHDVSANARLTRTAIREEGFHSLAVVPLSSKGKVMGTLFVLTRNYREFTAQDVQLLISIGHQIGVAIENARLYEQARQLAATEERSRLARDLHDAVTQTLFSASLIAEALPTIWADDQGEGRQLLEEIRRLSRGALAEMRTLLLELRPAVLTETSLGDLLRQLSEAVIGRTGLPVTVSVEGQPALPPMVHVALYHIAQEALNNVVKHARANRVMVSLCCGTLALGQEMRVELSIADDGRGFDLRRVPPDHLGLGIMRERAQAIGAALEIESEPGRGTRIAVTWKEGEQR